MSSTKKSLYFKWLALSVLITSVCIGAGLYITSYLARTEERTQRELLRERSRGRPLQLMKHRHEIMLQLISRHNLSAEAAFQMVDRAHESPFPEASVLLDDDYDVILSHASRSWNPRKHKAYSDFPLTDDRIYRVYFDDRFARRFGPDGKPRLSQGASKGALLVGSMAVGVSMVVGLALSLIILTLYLRKRARLLEEVMHRIKSGDLKARIKETATDETGQLMQKFNEMADEIETLVGNLRSTEESRKKLLQELAHDLRTPVASVKNLQETLFTKGDLLAPEKKKQLELLATKEVSYFERLVEDLLFLSGVNDPRYSQAAKSVDLSELLQEELEHFEGGTKRLMKSIDPQVEVVGDEHLLRRLLKNALSNSLRYAKDVVMVELNPTKDAVQLTIRDDGPGFKEDELQQFGEKKFSRQLTEDSAGHISVGLGSVIMKKIMTLSNGTLKVRNTHPGAKLTFTFPKS